MSATVDNHTMLSSINSHAEKIIDHLGFSMDYDQRQVLDFLLEIQGVHTHHIDWRVFYDWLFSYRGIHTFTLNKKNRWNCACGISREHWEYLVASSPSPFISVEDVLMQPGAICTLKSNVDNVLGSWRRLDEFKEFLGNTAR